MVVQTLRQEATGDLALLRRYVEVAGDGDSPGPPSVLSLVDITSAVEFAETPVEVTTAFTLSRIPAHTARVHKHHSNLIKFGLNPRVYRVEARPVYRGGHAPPRNLRSGFSHKEGPL